MLTKGVSKGEVSFGGGRRLDAPRFKEFKPCDLAEMEEEVVEDAGESERLRRKFWY